jgi:hypothetical protein
VFRPSLIILTAKKFLVEVAYKFSAIGYNNVPLIVTGIRKKPIGHREFAIFTDETCEIISATSEGFSYYFTGIKSQNLSMMKSVDVIPDFQKLIETKENYTMFKYDKSMVEVYLMFGYYSIGEGDINFLNVVLDEDEAKLFIMENKHVNE